MKRGAIRDGGEPPEPRIPLKLHADYGATASGYGAKLLLSTQLTTAMRSSLVKTSFHAGIFL